MALHFRSAFLIEGLRLDEPLELAPFVLYPVDGYIGRDGREIFNQALADIGFVSLVDAVAWGVQIGLHRRLALAVSRPLALDLADEVLVPLEVNRAIDLLSVSLGGAPTVVAGVTEISEDDGASWRLLAIRTGLGRRYPGSTLEALGDRHGLPPFDVPALWLAHREDPRVPLWASLFRNVGAERAWDRRIFHAFSLLETIAKSTVEKDTPVVDQHGDAILDEAGTPRTTNSSRGFVYMAVRTVLDLDGNDESMLLAHPSRGLWDEVGIWFDVRNAVAHEGSWRPIGLPSQTRQSHRERVTAAFELAGRGDEGLDSGWQRYEDACVAGAELVLRAAVRGDLGRR